MIKPDQIPDHVWHTAMSTYHKTIRKRPGSAWQEALAAALAAWPEVHWVGDFGLHLPLPKKESSND